MERDAGLAFVSPLSGRVPDLSVPEKVRLLDAARSAAHGDPGAEAWVIQVLGNFLTRGKAFPPIPSALAERVSNISGTNTGTLDEWIWLAIKMAEGVRAKGISPHKVTRVSVEAAVGFADLAARQWNNAKRVREAHLVVAQRLEPTWEWEREGRRARICIGKLGFDVFFGGSPVRNHWTMGWGPDEATREFLGRHAPNGGTGLFPKIDKALKGILREFMERHQPDSLEVAGADAKRNSHNAANYAACAPDGFAMETVVEPGAWNADAAGVRAIRFVRREPVNAMAPR